MNTGEYRVGIDFNPSGNDAVGFMKYKAAQLINEIEGIYNPDGGPEVERLKALAATAVEEAAMWAVKAITKKPRPV